MHLHLQTADQNSTTSSLLTKKLRDFFARFPIPNNSNVIEIYVPEEMKLH